MGYFFSQTWMWWLLAIVLAVAITWLLFRERKHKDKLNVNDRRAYGERGQFQGDADRTRVDNPIDSQGVNIPDQHRSLKERAEELKEKAEARTGRRKFF